MHSIDNCLLIGDKGPILTLDEIRNLYSSGNKQLIEISNGLTSKIQPFDISINYSFKNAGKNKYISYFTSFIRFN